jgi:hypothetical protein
MHSYKQELLSNFLGSSFSVNFHRLTHNNFIPTQNSRRRGIFALLQRRGTEDNLFCGSVEEFKPFPFKVSSHTFHEFSKVLVNITGLFHDFSIHYIFKVFQVPWAPWAEPLLQNQQKNSGWPSTKSLDLLHNMKNVLYLIAWIFGGRHCNLVHR